MGPAGPQIAKKVNFAQDVPESARGQGETDGSQHLAWLLSAAKGRGQDSYEYLLLLRFVIVNMVGVAMFAAAYLHGFVAMVVAADPTRLWLVIFATFLVGFVLCAWKAVQ
ncbi:MAG: hypothetical protein V3V75_11100, partial [Thermoguttaceae bacterium]